MERVDVVVRIEVREIGHALTDRCLDLSGRQDLHRVQH